MTIRKALATFIISLVILPMGLFVLLCCIVTLPLRFFGGIIALTLTIATKSSITRWPYRSTRPEPAEWSSSSADCPKSASDAATWPR